MNTISNQQSNPSKPALFSQQSAQKKLTRKQKVFADYVINNPKKPIYLAAKEAYQIANDNVARAISSENLTKPNILLYIQDHTHRAEQVIVEAMEAEKDIYRFNKDLGGYERVGSEKDHAIRLKAADSLLDRVHGKATQRIENHNTSVNLTIDLTGSQGS